MATLRCPRCGAIMEEKRVSGYHALLSNDVKEVNINIMTDRYECPEHPDIAVMNKPELKDLIFRVEALGKVRTMDALLEHVEQDPMIEYEVKDRKKK